MAKRGKTNPIKPVWKGIPALRSSCVAIDSVKPDPENDLKHGDEDIGKTANSLLRSGQQKAIVLMPDGKTTLAGAGTLLAAKKLGWTHIAANRTDLKDPTEQRIYAIADNQTGRNAAWDPLFLVPHLDDVENALAVDRIEQFGFDPVELRMMKPLGEGETPANQLPAEVQKRCKPGQLWTLGDHRLLCGDATKPDDVSRVLDGQTPTLCVTDPPYGVEYNPKWRTEAAEKGQLSYAATRMGNVNNDDRADWREVWALFPGSVIYAWCAAGDLMIVAGTSILESGFQIRNSIIWRKSNFPISRGAYTYQHEPCWYAVRKGNKAHWIGDKNASSVWEVTLDKNVAGGHSTQKPVELFTRPIGNHTGDVYEPFTGSGTCVIACEQLERRCFAMEIDPEYCDVVLQRWEEFTGKDASLAKA